MFPDLANKLNLNFGVCKLPFSISYTEGFGVCYVGWRQLCVFSFDHGMAFLLQHDSPARESSSRDGERILICNRMRMRRYHSSHFLSHHPQIMIWKAISACLFLSYVGTFLVWRPSTWLIFLLIFCPPFLYMICSPPNITLMCNMPVYQARESDWVSERSLWKEIELDPISLAPSLYLMIDRREERRMRLRITLGK